jgi:hypothetical protein
MPARKDLGSILVDEDVLDAKDLERVRDAQPLWSALIDRELASAEQIFRAMSARFGVPVVSDERLTDVTVPDKLKRVLGRQEALTMGLLPVDLSNDGQRATVVMVDPSDEKVLAQFLTRAHVPEGRALLGRREPLLRAIDRCLSGDTTAVVAPLPPPRRVPQTPPASPRVAKPVPVKEDDITGTVKLDPELQVEIQKLPGRARESEPATSPPRVSQRPRRSTPSPTPPPMSAGVVLPPAIPPSLDEGRTPAESPLEGLRAEERLTRALIAVIEALAVELEARVATPAAGAIGEANGATRGAREASGIAAPIGGEMARLCRRVARQLNVPRRQADEIGVAAQLYAVDRTLRAAAGGTAPDVFAALGWSAAGDGGVLPMLRALTAASSGFQRASAGVPLGARIIGAVADYLELGAASHAPDLGTVSQLLRASPAGAQVVDALLKVLQEERADITPAQPTTLPATSVLKEVPDDEAPTPEPEPDPDNETLSDQDKTQRRPIPRKSQISNQMPNQITNKKAEEKGD